MKILLRELKDNMTNNNIHIIGIPEEEEQRVENLFETVIEENFPNLRREKSYANPGSTESPNQDEPKEAHSKTHQ